MTPSLRDATAGQGWLDRPDDSGFTQRSRLQASHTCRLALRCHRREPSHRISRLNATESVKAGPGDSATFGRGRQAGADGGRQCVARRRRRRRQPVHLVATGAAVRRAGRSRLGFSATCCTAALSGQDVHLLARAGYRPVGIVKRGVCAYHVGWRGITAWAGSSGTTRR